MMFRCYRQALACFVVTVCLAEIPTATAEPLKLSPLKDLRELNLLVEELPAAAAKCGITEDQLHASVHAILDSSKIELVRKVVPNKLYLNVNVLNSCASNFSLKIITPVTVDSNGQHDLEGDVWDTGGIREGGDPGKDANKQIEEALRQLVEEWNLENQ